MVSFLNSIDPSTYFLEQDHNEKDLIWASVDVHPLDRDVKQFDSSFLQVWSGVGMVEETWTAVLKALVRSYEWKFGRKIFQKRCRVV